ncbi:MAG: HhoA/HhoB/HtrA family serine endopeptidase [Spirulinaceae cyanobacterium]
MQINNLDSSSPQKSNPLKKTVTYLSLVLLGAGIAFGSNALVEQKELSALVPDSSTQLQEKKVAAPPINSSLIPNNFVTEVVDTVGDSVVRIDASRQTGRFRMSEGTGSGFIISKDGQILTNAHVVDGIDTVTVTLKDGRTIEGTVMGSDPVTDVAVIKVEEKNLPAAALGDSDQLKPGEWAIAIGNPLGLNNTVTTGIISATGRSSSQVGVADKRVDFVQTDAAINPGNSGGPLLNQNGEVIGINTAIFRDAQGIGFAIPINTAKDIADQLVAKGKVEHPYLGIQMVDLNPEIKENINSNPQNGFRVEAQEGVIIAGIVPNSPAAQAGLQTGDVLQSINEDQVIDSQTVQNIVNKVPVGEKVSLKLDRQGKAVELNLKVGVLPPNLK